MEFNDSASDTDSFGNHTTMMTLFLIHYKESIHYKEQSNLIG